LLCWYASIGDIKNLKMMINLDCDLNNGDYDGRTALHLASAEEQIETIQLLIKRKAKTSNKDRY
jgi:glutaminase